MNSFLPSWLFQFMKPDLFIVAGLLPAINEEVGFLLGAALLVIGTLLQWQAPRQRMSAEERKKDGKLTEQQAVRMNRFYTVSGPLLTLAGATLMIWAMSRYLA